MAAVSYICHVKGLNSLQAGRFWASQKDLLYLERGPQRYVLAWSVWSDRTHSTRMLRTATPETVYMDSCHMKQLKLLPLTPQPLRKTGYSAVKLL